MKSKIRATTDCLPLLPHVEKRRQSRTKRKRVEQRQSESGRQRRGRERGEEIE
jgi:hypothetical protein